MFTTIGKNCEKTLLNAENTFMRTRSELVTTLSGQNVVLHLFALNNYTIAGELLLNVFRKVVKEVRGQSVSRIYNNRLVYEGNQDILLLPNTREIYILLCSILSIIRKRYLHTDTCHERT